jgi:hypothetical protein
VGNGSVQDGLDGLDNHDTSRNAQYAIAKQQVLAWESSTTTPRIPPPSMASTLQADRVTARRYSDCVTRTRRSPGVVFLICK